MWLDTAQGAIESELLGRPPKNVDWEAPAGISKEKVNVETGALDRDGGVDIFVERDQEGALVRYFTPVQGDGSWRADFLIPHKEFAEDTGVDIFEFMED